ncbi:MAG: adenylate/guanylate cyclase domain-containing protein [Gemmataceae bacterium]|nr:adenylate/guanylate cyclase domain-containing protein [Gemmataceae bacterium]
MAELEAITDIKPTNERPGAAPRQYGRRFPLRPGQPMTLGREEAKVDCAVPEDDQIARFQATLEWDAPAERLTVRTRPALPPEYPKPPPNETEVFDPRAKQLVRVAGGRCEVGPGGSFFIGQTRFTVRREGDSDAESPVDATIALQKLDPTRAQLEAIPFADPAAVLAALEQLPATIRAAAPNEQSLYRRLLKAVMDALPRVAAAAVVRVPAGADGRLAVVESHVRSADLVGPKFAPSRKLCQQAVGGPLKRSHLHLWSTDPKDAVAPPPGAGSDMTLALLHTKHLTPWAVCTPFQDGSRTALYLAGHVPGAWAELDPPARERVKADLTQCQKIADLIVGLVEATLQLTRLSRQVEVVRRAWPRNTWQYLDTPDRLDDLLRPREKEVTVLFCDLRNYSRFAAENEADLLRAWKEVAHSLDAMSGTITLLDGVVAGFRGDAVLGFWGWPDPQDAQVARAAQAALAIREKLGGWLLDRNSGLGLTHGRAVAGRLGANDLAVIDLYGPVVNLAFRLEAMTKAFGVGVIVADEVAARVAADPNAGRFRTRPLGRVRAKGFPDPVAAHELFSAVTPTLTDRQLASWAAAVEHFTRGEWAEAADLFDQTCPEDPAAQCLLRVMDRAGRKPPPDWDGSFRPPGPDDE